MTNTLPGTATLSGERTTTDAETADVALAASGDARAFERLYRGHVGRIHGLVRRMIDDAAADDVTQDVFVRAWEKLSTFRGEAAFGTWLHRVAINVILARRTGIGLDRARLDGGDALDAVPGRTIPTDLSVDFEAAIETLPDGARQVFVLHDIEGYKHEEIGSLLGIAVGTSKSQLHRARMTLREYLDR